MVVFLFGPAGSGKTLAVDEFARHETASTRWLNLRNGESRLAEHVGGAEPDELVVADGLDRLDPRAQDALAELLRRLPTGARAVVTSRLAPPPAMARDRLDGRVRVIDPDVLALDGDEAVELAAGYGLRAEPAATMHADCCGWIAGLVLQARASRSAVDRDALSAYITAEILPALSPSLRFALACTARLPWVTERLLVELAEDESIAPELLHVPLPGELTRAGLRLAPCVRRVLAATTDGAAARRACARASWSLRAAGASADAAEALISAGQLLAAEAPAADAATRGAETARVLGWLEVLGPGASRRRPSLRETELRALLHEGEHASVAGLARAMRADGELEGLLARGEPAAAWAAASLVRGGHAVDVLALVEASEHPIWAPAVWALAVLCKAEPVSPPLDLGAVATLPLASVVAEALLWRGRPADAAALLDLAESHDPGVPLERARQLLALGDLERARRTAGAEVRRSYPGRAAALECELAVARGQPDRALALVTAARAAAERAGDLVTARIDLVLVEAHALWLGGAPRRALPTLNAARTWAVGRGLRAAAEWIDVWLAGVTLATGSAAAARARVEQSLADMADATRTRGRPFAAIILADACWQLGDEAGHDEAVDEAVRSALRSGGRLMLRAAAALVPDPLVRRDRGSAAPGVQRRLVDLAIASADAPSLPDAVLRLRTLGETGLESIPDRQPFGRIGEVEILLAYLAARGGAAPIEDVLDDVMPESNGRVLLRRATKKAQDVLPAGVRLELTSTALRIEPRAAVVSDDGEVIRLAGAVARARGQEAAELRTALRALAAAGPYLPGTDAPWAQARREEVARAVSDCLAPGSDPPGSEPDESDLASAAQLVPTWRLHLRRALAKGIPLEGPDAPTDTDWRQQSPPGALRE